MTSKLTLLLTIAKCIFFTRIYFKLWIWHFSTQKYVMFNGTIGMNLSNQLHKVNVAKVIEIYSYLSLIENLIFWFHWKKCISCVVSIQVGSFDWRPRWLWATMTASIIGCQPNSIEMALIWHWKSEFVTFFMKLGSQTVSFGALAW